MRLATMSAALIICLGFPISALAEPWGIIINALMQMATSEAGIDQSSLSEVSSLDKITNGLSGVHNYGRIGYNDSRYSWGANNWQEILAMANGGGSGDLADAIGRLRGEFPSNEPLNSNNDSENKYYDLVYKTALASRAASEVAYKQANDEEKTVSNLNKQIDMAQDEKSASDLNNRLAAEQASSSLQQTKLLSVIVQQQAIEQQEKTNIAKENMKFLR